MGDSEPALRCQEVLDDDLKRALDFSRRERSPQQKQDDMTAYDLLSLSDADLNFVNAAIKTAPHYKEYRAYVRDECGEEDYEASGL